MNYQPTTGYMTFRDNNFLFSWKDVSEILIYFTRLIIDLEAIPGFYLFVCFCFVSYNGLPKLAVL